VRAVAFAPGGVTDTFARLMAQKLTEQLGKQVYVENIAGASGNLGTGQVAKAAADGYSILFAFRSHVVNPTLGLEQIEANVGTTNRSMAAMSVAWLRRKARHPCDGGPHRALSSAYQGSSHSEGRSGPL
jgi:Tripartite tricarboxylate transporter family receptor